MASEPFRILSLSGGGCRGIFQAVFLSRLQQRLGAPLHTKFDLIAGTSTGSIIAMALALGIDINRVVDLYRNDSDKIFSSKWFYFIRKGPRYNQQTLKTLLENVFANKQLRDVKTPIVITATCLDRFSHKLFSSFPAGDGFDNDLSAVDIVLSSSAAPTYFDAVKPSSQERSYVDGGLWANSPSLAAVLSAKSYLNKPLNSMRVLSIGTCDFPQGILRDRLNQSRSLSPSTIQNIFEMMFSAQQSSADDYARTLLGTGEFIRISAQMDEFIALNDVKKALSKLPSLAEIEADKHMDKILEMLRSDLPSETIGEESLRMTEKDKTFIPVSLVEATGLTGFFPSRKFYSFRSGASSIDTYVDKAKKTLVMISINLLTGVEFHGLCDVLRTKLENTDNHFSVTISLLNPLKADSIFAISPVLNKTKDGLFRSIKDTLDKLVEFRSGLSRKAQERFEIRVHNTIPFGSAIMIDHNEEYGTIQIETKPYKAVLDDSFAFEIAPYGSSGFFRTLAKGYEQLLKDGHKIEEVDLMAAVFTK